MKTLTFSLLGAAVAGGVLLLRLRPILVAGTPLVPARGELRDEPRELFLDRLRERGM